MLALRFADQSVHGPFFRQIFQALRAAEPASALQNPLHEFLTSTAVNSRTDDDKTLILATRRLPDDPRTVYYDNQNHRVELGPLLASGEGGEGKVFKVVGQPASVAKITTSRRSLQTARRNSKACSPCLGPTRGPWPGRRRPCIKRSEGRLSAF